MSLSAGLESIPYVDVFLKSKSDRYGSCFAHLALRIRAFAILTACSAFQFDWANVGEDVTCSMFQSVAKFLKSSDAY